MKPNIVKCPFCEGTKFIEGIQKGHGEVHGEGFLSVVPLKHIICIECGCVVRSYVDNPIELLKYKDREVE